MAYAKFQEMVETTMRLLSRLILVKDWQVC